jgi:hypothetical protein
MKKDINPHIRKAMEPSSETCTSEEGFFFAHLFKNHVTRGELWLRYKKSAKYWAQTVNP